VFHVAIGEDNLVFKTELCMTYTVMSIMCAVIARMSSDIPVPH
jgi:hypothetical protein